MPGLLNKLEAMLDSKLASLSTKVTENTKKIEEQDENTFAYNRKPTRSTIESVRSSWCDRVSVTSQCDRVSAIESVRRVCAIESVGRGGAIKSVRRGGATS